MEKLTADKAREIALKTKDRNLDSILILIRQASENGCFDLNIEKLPSVLTQRKLIGLGYKIKEGLSSFYINW